MCMCTGSEEQEGDGDEAMEDDALLANSWLMVGAEQDRLRPFFMASSTSESASTSPQSTGSPDGGVSTSMEGYGTVPVLSQFKRNSQQYSCCRAGGSIPVISRCNNK